MSSPIAGAWEMVSDSQNGLAVFSDTYYSIVMAAKNRMKFKTAEPTAEEAAEAYRTLSTAAGSYELSGTTMVCHRLANRNPNWTGVDASFEFTIEGDRLTMKGDSNAQPWVWRKLE